MVDIGDIFEHAEHGRVEVLDFEERLTMDRTGTTDTSTNVRFLPLDEELAKENIREEPYQVFDSMTDKSESDS